ncbi:MAG: PxKF domain-containing protein, partial [Candidatus Acidiferrales bacterium]
HMLTVAWNGTDALSGIASCSAASNYAGPDSASASVNGACTDQAGNSTGAIVSFKFDATKPAINIATPSSGAAYLLNAAVNADYGCTDTASGVQSCSGPVASGAAVNTASVGAKQFTVNSRDVAGNTASATHNYSVHYAFSGFANPIGPMPMVNVANAGRTVPVKYSLQDANGALISDLASFVSLMSGPVACNATAPGVLAEETDAAGSTTMRYTGNEFHYNWKTDKSWAGTCRALQLTLSDGAQHWAMFQFK